MFKLNNLNKDRLILLIIVIIVAFSIFFSIKSPIAKLVRSGQPINGLIIGTDWVDYARHSDTLVFVDYDPHNRFLNIVSVPRDTHFSPEGLHLSRINEVYAYNYRIKKDDHYACTQVCRAVEELFGGRVNIPFYIQINYSGFKRFIDLIGGVDIEIEEAMNYDDGAQNLHIHFEPGKYHLDGARALEFVRYRGKSGDLGRVSRQQRFLKSALAKFRSRTRRYDVVMYVYVTAEDGTLKGVVDIRELIQAKSDEPLRNIMSGQIVTLSPGDALADAAGEFSKYGFRALPMVDEARKLQGVIRYKDLLSVMQ